MKRNTTLFRCGTIVLATICALLTVSCSSDSDNEAAAPPQPPTPQINEFAISRDVASSRVNLDANSPEIATICSTTNDTVAYYGEKNADGTAKTVKVMTMANTTDNATIRFDDQKRPAEVAFSDGSKIELSWLDNTSAVVKAYDHSTNSYISTVWHTDSTPTADEATPAKAPAKAGVRQGKMTMSVKAAAPMARPKHAPTANADASQKFTFYIHQCEAFIDASNFIALYNAGTNEFLGNIYYDSHPSTGTYSYTLPAGSYPTEASHEQVCKDIDKALFTIAVGVKMLLEADKSLAEWLANAAQTTGGQLSPAMLRMLAFIADNADFALKLIGNDTLEEIMKNLAPEWYYKEYTATNIVLRPAVSSEGKIVWGEPQTIHSYDGDFIISQELEGLPVIDSFVLTPGYPAAGQKYEAKAIFHCIPTGSQVTVSIIGTDGYKNSKTETITSPSGEAILWVPGAATGVYDVCTVNIVMPDGQELTMQASLVFGTNK